MKLIISSTSPYSRKCRVMVREFALGDMIEEVEAHPFDDDPDLLRANPLGRVPCLLMDDGQALTGADAVHQATRRLCGDGHQAADSGDSAAECADPCTPSNDPVGGMVQVVDRGG